MFKDNLAILFGLVRITIVFGLSHSFLACQEMPEQHFGTRLISIRLVDAFGADVDVSSVYVDGSPASKILGVYYQIPRTKSRIQVNAKSYREIDYELAAGSESVDIVLCTSFEPITRLAPFKVLQKFSFDAAIPCNRLVVTPVHCGLTIKPQYFNLLQSRTLVISLEQGLYALHLVDGDKVCKTATVMVPASDEVKIK